MPTKDWKAELEARANRVYEDKEVFLAYIESRWAETEAHIEEFAEDMWDTVNRCCEEDRPDLAIDMLNEMKDYLSESQRTDMRKGYGPNTTDEDRTIADSQVEFVGIYIELVDALLADLLEEKGEEE
jgi:hypothetical protein